MSKDFENKHPRDKQGQFIDKHKSVKPDIELEGEIGGVYDENPWVQELYEKHGAGINYYLEEPKFYPTINGPYGYAEVYVDHDPMSDVVEFSMATFDTKQDKYKWRFDGEKVIYCRGEEEQTLTHFDHIEGESDMEGAERFVSLLDQCVTYAHDIPNIDKDDIVELSERAHLALIHYKKIHKEEENQ